MMLSGWLHGKQSYLGCLAIRRHPEMLVDDGAFCVPFGFFERSVSRLTFAAPTLR
jgi:hypothetical protein